MANWKTLADFPPEAGVYLLLCFCSLVLQWDVACRNCSRPFCPGMVGTLPGE